MKKILYSLFGLAVLLTACTDPVNEPKDPDVIDTPSDSIPSKPTKYEESDYLFDLSELSQVTLIVSEKEWNKLLSNFDAQPHNNEYVVGTFVYKKGGETYSVDSVGVRLRGNTSRRRPEGVYQGGPHNSANPEWHHAHFQVKFDEYRNKQYLFGNDRVILKWHKDDAMYCREVYSYDLFRRFGVWTAPRACYTRLSLQVGNEQAANFGVYALIEGVNKRFLKNREGAGRWQTNDGNLWKAAGGANLSPSTMNDATMGVSISTVKEIVDYIYDLKTNKKTGLETAKMQLKDFVNGLNSRQGGSEDLKNYLETHMDVDQFLRAYAVNVMVGMWDDYWYNSNNYYFYFDTDGKFYFIPFDYDNTLGTSMGMNSGTQNLLEWGSLDNDRMLMRKVMSISEYKERYKQYIRELASSENDYFYTDKSIARIKKWHSMISSYIKNDTGEDMEIVDVPATWGNCSFYSIFDGNDQGGNMGKANWFKTKIKSAKAVVGDDGDEDQEVAANLYLRGNITGWQAVPEYQFEQKGTVYTLNKEFDLEGTFKFGDEEWSVLDFGASDAAGLLQLNTPTQMLFRGPNFNTGDDVYHVTSIVVNVADNSCTVYGNK